MNNPGNDEQDARIQAFLQLLRQQPNEDNCQSCLDQLYDYTITQQAGHQDNTPLTQTKRHLDSCVTCAEAYAQLYDMILADTQGQLAHPQTIPIPDLSFLTTPPNLLSLLSQAIQQTKQQWHIQLNERLTTLLTPSPQAALTRSNNEGRYGKKLLELTPAQLPNTTLPLTLTAYADQAHPQHCLIELTIEPTNISWPNLGGRTATLIAKSHTQTVQTDEWGTAVFSNIPLTDLDTLQLTILDIPH